MVHASPDIDASLNWYANAFGMTFGPVWQTSIGVVQRAQGLEPSQTLGLALIRLTEHGNMIEFDGYSPAHSGPRTAICNRSRPGWRTNRTD